MNDDSIHMTVTHPVPATVLPSALAYISSTGKKKQDARAVIGSWMDPDWVPEMLTVGAGGKGRSMRHSGYDGDMPIIGHGRKNPNERRRKK